MDQDPSQSTSAGEEPKAGNGETSEKREQGIRRALHTIEHETKPWMERASHAMKKPVVAAAVAGGAVAAAAGMWGPTEAAFGALAAYAVYALMKRRGRAERKRDSGERAEKAEAHH